METGSGGTRADRVRGADRAELSARLRMAYEQGATIRGLAGAHHSPYSLVHQLLVEAGVVFRARGGRYH